MKSIRELYTIGRGPSSSHTMGPARAAALFRGEHPEADHFRVVLYGSLALTGRGHLTDQAVQEALAPVDTEIVFDSSTGDLPHPNTMDLFACRGGAQTGFLRVLSTGGGAITLVGRPEAVLPEVYVETSYAEIAAWCKSHNARLPDYVEHNEGKGIWDDLYRVWEAMKRSIVRGLSVSGELPGGLHVERKAQFLH